MTTSLVQREISPAAAAIADSIGVFIVLVGLGALGIIATIWLISDRYFVSVSDMAAGAFIPPELMSKLPSKSAKA